MNKKLLFTTLMVGTTLCSNIGANINKPNNFNIERKMTAKNADASEANEEKEEEESVDEETAAEYVSSQVMLNEEQRTAFVNKIMNAIGSNANTMSTTSSSYIEYDMFFASNSTPFWNEVALRYNLNETMYIADYFTLSCDLTEHYYSRNVSDDDSDAFRHIVYMALLTNKFGAEFTREFMTFYGGYSGTDIKQSNRYSMDNHNDNIGVMIGIQYHDGYSNTMSGYAENNIGKYATHVVKFGEYYDVLKLTNDDLGFVHTTQGIQNINFPPFC